MRHSRLTFLALFLLAACTESEDGGGTSSDGGAVDGSAGADATANIGGEPNAGTGGSSIAGAGGSISAGTGGTTATGGGGSSGASGSGGVSADGGVGGAGGAVPSDDAGSDCVATECLCEAFAACEPSEFSRSIGQDGVYVDLICGVVDGECSVISYIRYPESGRVWRCSYPSDAPCDAEGSGLNASASPYCVPATCSASGTACTEEFFACP